jgi:hypothetical protein
MAVLVRGMAVYYFQKLAVNPSMELSPASMREKVSENNTQPYLFVREWCHMGFSEFAY